MAEEHDVHFESADAGASLTYPQQAGTVRKNGFLVIKGRPCKVCPAATHNCRSIRRQLHTLWGAVGALPAAEGLLCKVVGEAAQLNKQA